MWISKGTKLQAGTVKMGSSGQKGGEKMMFLGAAARRQQGSDSVAAGQGRGVAGVWQGRGRGVAGCGRAGQQQAGRSPGPAARRSLRAGVVGGRNESPSTGFRTGEGDKDHVNSGQGGHTGRECK